MDIKIKFDDECMPQTPTFVLATRSGEYIGAVPAVNITCKNPWNANADLMFRVYKYDNDVEYQYWHELKDFRLVWCREWNAWFEISVELEEAPHISKIITCTSLAEAELGQIMLYETEINTEDDIARSDYIPTVLYQPDKPRGSLLTRILKKAPNYIIEHVDDSIKNIQRTFSFHDVSIYDAFQTITEEIDCIAIFRAYTTDTGEIKRSISVYDLENSCSACGERGTFEDICPKCGSTNITPGYGEDTTVFVSVDNLADNINYTTDVGSVKNCFRLEAGDDLMTAAIVACNPNGTQYLWHFSDDMKSDMSQALVKKINNYDQLYQSYLTTHEISIGNTKLLQQYNQIVTKYNNLHSQNFSTIESPLHGFSELMRAYYNVIDFDLYLSHGMMPSPPPAPDSATEQATLLETEHMPAVAVLSIPKCTVSTASSAVQAMARVVVDPHFQVRVGDSALSDITTEASGEQYRQWTGTFVITNYDDDTDTATTNSISIRITNEYISYVQQRMQSLLDRHSEDVSDIVTLFQLPIANFKQELKKYGQASLQIFYDACQSCMDVLIQQQAYADYTDVATSYYNNYYERLSALSDELAVRASEIAVVSGQQVGVVAGHSMLEILQAKRTKIQAALDFETYLGENLWLEFSLYRRECSFSNSNYISDGLDNFQLFQRAQEFFDKASQEIYKSANLQHSITATLKNLLAMEEFKPLVQHFQCGNWIRIRVDDNVYRLRLISYDIDFDDLTHITVEFSDVKQVSNGVTDAESIFAQAKQMATSYTATQRQASKGNKSSRQVQNWVDDGLSLTTMKIVNDASNQDIVYSDSGITLREKIPFTDEYDPRQIKLINQGLYVTNDNWQTSSAGVGHFYYYDPATGNIVDDYGVIANTIVGNLLLGKNLGIYNSDGSVTVNENGLTLTTNTDDDQSQKNIFTIQKETDNQDGTKTTIPLLYIDDDGNLVLNGSMKIVSDIEGVTTRTFDDVAADVDEIKSQDRYRVETVVSGVNIFNSRNQSSRMECHVYSWDKDITDTINASCFAWHRHSANPNSDATWDAAHKGMKYIVVSTEDVFQNASFTCEVTLE